MSKSWRESKGSPSPSARAKTKSIAHEHEHEHEHEHHIVGEGAYGCIAAPALPCEGHRDADYTGLVSKVLQASEATKELEESARIAAIDQLVAGTRGRTDARYRFGVYALDRCPLTQDPTEADAWKRQADARKATQKGSRCGARDRSFVVHMEAAQGDVTLLGEFSVQEALAQNKEAQGRWMRALGNALAGIVHLHAHGFFHFDVKPDNMLWFSDADTDDRSPSGVRTVKLADFGEARAESDAHLPWATPLTGAWWNYPPGAQVAWAAALKQTWEKSQAARARTVSWADARDVHQKTLHALEDATRYWVAADLSPASPFASPASAASVAKKQVVRRRLAEWEQRGVRAVRPVEDTYTPSPQRRPGQRQGQRQSQRQSQRQGQDQGQGQGARAVPAFADARAFTGDGIFADARTAARDLTPHALFAAIDMFGFALALAPMHDVFVRARNARAAERVKTFFDRAARMHLPDEDAERAFAHIALAL